MEPAQDSLWPAETPEKQSDAVIVGQYRYALWRRWEPGSKQLLWVLLNPSSADSETDDPTLRRLLFYSKRLGFNSLAVGNLFAYRSPSPDALPRDKEAAIGPENDRYLLQLAYESTEIVVGWGAGGGLHGRDPVVLKLLQRVQKSLFCLGYTQYGAPRHPLYCRNDAEFLPHPRK